MPACLLASLPFSTGGFSAASPLALALAKNRLAKNVGQIVETHHLEWHEISAVTRMCASTVEPPIKTLIVAEK